MGKVVVMRTAYKCRAYPNPQQAAIFGRTFGCVRVVWNKTLAERRHAWYIEGTPTTYKQADAALTAWKKTEHLAFLSEVSSVPPSRRCATSTPRSPTSSPDAPATPLQNPHRPPVRALHSLGVPHARGELRMARTTAPLAFVWSFDEVDLATLDPTMVVISREPDGRWYVTFAVDTGNPEPLPVAGHAIGIDLG